MPQTSQPAVIYAHPNYFLEGVGQLANAGANIYSTVRQTQLADQYQRLAEQTAASKYSPEEQPNFWANMGRKDKMQTLHTTEGMKQQQGMAGAQEALDTAARGTLRQPQAGGSSAAGAPPSQASPNTPPDTSASAPPPPQTPSAAGQEGAQAGATAQVPAPAGGQTGALAQPAEQPNVEGHEAQAATPDHIAGMAEAHNALEHVQSSIPPQVQQAANLTDTSRSGAVASMYMPQTFPPKSADDLYLRHLAVQPIVNAYLSGEPVSAETAAAANRELSMTPQQRTQEYGRMIAASGLNAQQFNALTYQALNPPGKPLPVEVKNVLATVSPEANQGFTQNVLPKVLGTVGPSVVSQATSEAAVTKEQAGLNYRTQAEIKQRQAEQATDLQKFEDQLAETTRHNQAGEKIDMTNQALTRQKMEMIENRYIEQFKQQGHKEDVYAAKGYMDEIRRDMASYGDNVGKLNGQIDGLLKTAGPEQVRAAGMLAKGVASLEAVQARIANTQAALGPNGQPGQPNPQDVALANQLKGQVKQYQDTLGASGMAPIVNQLQDLYTQRAEQSRHYTERMTDFRDASNHFQSVMNYESQGGRSGSIPLDPREAAMKIVQANPNDPNGAAAIAKRYGVPQTLIDQGYKGGFKMPPPENPLQAPGGEGVNPSQQITSKSGEAVSDITDSAGASRIGPAPGAGGGGGSDWAQASAPAQGATPQPAPKMPAGGYLNVEDVAKLAPAGSQPTPDQLDSMLSKWRPYNDAFAAYQKAEKEWQSPEKRTAQKATDAYTRYTAAWHQLNFLRDQLQNQFASPAPPRAPSLSHPGAWQ